MKRVLVSIAVLMVGAAAGAEDVAGSKDHALLTRYPDSHITEYTKNYNATEYQVGAKGAPPKTETVEGDVTTIRYFYASPEQQPSPLQLIRNYQNAIKQIGGAVVYERLPRDLDAGETTLKVTTGGKDVWIKVLPDIFSAPTQSYQLVVTEVAAMAQVVSANQLLDELNRNGYVALYVNFDTGKADLKDDGVATVKEIVKLLNGNPGIKLSVEGHTDNVGDAASNKKLSEARARSVASAIIAGGVANTRLTSIGYGQEKPVADNRSEEGRAKNRRVELVRK
jgi:OmpA-OmpF porin, OOP family